MHDWHSVPRREPPVSEPHHLAWFASMGVRRCCSTVAGMNTNVGMKPNTRIVHQALRRAAKGARAGLLAACLPAAIALAGAVLRARGSAADGSVNLLTALMAYFAAGAMLGAFVGIVLPLPRWAAGAVFVGVICGFALYSMAALIVSGPARYRPLVPLALGALLGGPIAFGAWKMDQRESRQGNGPADTTTRPR